MRKRIIARYKAAAAREMIRAWWGNLTDFVGSLESLEQELTDLAKFVNELHVVQRTYAKKASELRSWTKSHAQWFRDYEPGSQPPSGLKSELEAWTDFEAPTLDDIGEVIGESKLAHTLARDAALRSKIEKAVNDLFDFVDGKTPSITTVQQMLKNFRVDPAPYRDLKTLLPEGWSKYEEFTEWVSDLSKAQPTELPALLEPWEDKIVLLGDDEFAETLMNSPALAKIGSLLEAVAEIEQAAGHLLRLLF